ncbi:MAG: hypothetical protein V1858_00760 [Candidatus Gottesmanbacteria bacterium]
MKIQDIIFLAIFLTTLWLRNYQLTAFIGLFCLILAMPLFVFWIFFTAQRLVIYGAIFFILTIILCLFDIKRRMP